MSKMKSKILILAMLSSVCITCFAAQPRIGARFIVHQGITKGAHWTVIPSVTQGRNTAVFLNVQARRGSCRPVSSGPLAHPSAILYFWPVCQGRNTGRGLHWAIINGDRINLGASLITHEF